MSALKKLLKNKPKIPSSLVFLGIITILAFYFLQDIQFSSFAINKNTFFSLFKNNQLKQLPSDQFDFTLLEESASPDESASANWWLNSGAKVLNQQGIIKTVQGSLSPDDRWFKAYLRSTPIDTDAGSHPQNIFRLVNKNNLQNIRQQAYFKINKTIISNSPNRNESNGILFFNRYYDGDNLYYTGIRVDGTAIIKKKINGTYFTMKQNEVFTGEYQKNTVPNLIPEQKWIGLKSEVENLNFKEVSIKLFIDKEANGKWEQIAEATDDGKSYNGSSFINAGHPGIRTDFMDIEFKDYKIEILK